jgi:hypothetical protein
VSGMVDFDWRLPGHGHHTGESTETELALGGVIVRFSAWITCPMIKHGVSV